VARSDDIPTGGARCPGRAFDRKPCQASFSLAAIGGFTTAEDRNLRIGRVRERRKSFRINACSVLDFQALPPAYRSDESAGSARGLALNPPEALVQTEPLV
jgi:hypothetical protein